MMRILIGIIGSLLIIFSALLLWTAYNSHKERVSLQNMMIARREESLRNLEN